ncbi:N-acetylmuramoyl-L-alanine amidase family protein [Robinsoniella sp. KNHs210]|uniref:N-acetylmuramoyl-L-alanine amidase family protein n=1 Tax=Robinsoniella sp. KNHs210 TaxID=1469950 RepID=UPI000489468D|nr:N-acetylmuramoyl-L-alanine amidase [Robinsoniella sp. KNHs210]
MHRNLVKCMGAAMAIVLLTTGCTFSGNGENTNKGETVTETVTETITESLSGSMTAKETGTENENQTNSNQKKSEKESENQAVTELKESESTEKNDSNANIKETEESKAQGPIVAVDAGHQGPGQDMSRTEANGPGSEVMKARLATGTTGSVSGLDEYELNLDVSLKLQTELEKRGYQVVMTRTTHEVDLGNIDRATIANEAGADILVRIHANGSEDSSVAGALTMAPTQSNPYVGSISEECMRLSQCLIDRYCEATGLINRGILAEDEMTGINWSQVPVTILEMGFMTNPGDDAYMADAANQDVMVQGIANGIDDYFGR